MSHAMENASSVSSFFAGKSVLVTGVSGFLGKMVLWKLLRDMPTCRTIHVLMRSRGASSADKRLQEILHREPFLSFGSGIDLDRVSLVVGDVLASSVDHPQLDLVCKDSAQSIQQFDVIIHGAALTQWDAPLEESLQTNAYGSLALLKHHLSPGGTFVYVSSAFANGIPPTISGEVVWEGPVPVSHVDFETLHHKALSMKGSREARGRAAVALCRQHGWWDPYSFSKAAAESFLAAHADSVGARLAVVRPSGMVGSVLEPTPGWNDAYMGTVPFIMALASKQMTLCSGTPSAKIDWFPADLAVNAIIVAAARACAAPTKSTSYFHVVSHDTNPVKLHEAIRDWSTLLESRGVGPIPPIEWKATAEEFKSAVHKRVKSVRSAHTVLESIPLVGKISAITSPLERVLQLVDKMVGLGTLYAPYMINEWRFDSSCTRKLMKESISESDRHIFPYNVEDFTWSHLWADHINGIYKYVLPEKRKSQSEQQKSDPKSTRKGTVSTHSAGPLQRRHGVKDSLVINSRL